MSSSAAAVVVAGLSVSFFCLVLLLYLGHVHFQFFFLEHEFFQLFFLLFSLCELFAGIVSSTSHRSEKFLTFDLKDACDFTLRFMEFVKEFFSQCIVYSCSQTSHQVF